jgi:PAS domain S-box-containing protein
MNRGADSIKRKLTFAIMLTSLTVLVVTGASFVTYELVTSNERWIAYMKTLADIVADGASSALMFEDKKVASETLATLDAEPHIVDAGIYNSNGVLFVWWPTNHAPDSLIQRNATEGFHFELNFVVGYHPIMHQDGSRIGTLFLKSDLGARRQRFRSYAGIVAVVFAASLLVALFLASILQKSISQPILALAETAKAISTRRDYSVRAVKSSRDEVGALTDAFNLMLTQIQERDAALSRSEEQFRQLANAVPAIVWTTNAEGSALYFNDQWYEYTGLSAEDSLGDKWIQPMHPDDRNGCIRLWKEALRTGKSYEDEVRFRGATGEYRWFLNRAQPTRDAEGKNFDVVRHEH